MAKEMTSRVKKFTTLEELEKSTIGSVYVLNNTRDSLEGNVIVSIPKKNGNGSDLVRVVKTFIPIEITNQVSRGQLMESSEFRKTVGKGLLKLITSEYATLLLGTDEAKAEVKRIQEDMQKAKAILKTAGVAEETSEEDEDEYVEVEQAKKQFKKEVSAKKNTKPSMKVQNLVASATRDGLSQVQIIGAMKNINTMTKADLSFLAKEYKDRPRIIKHLKEKLAEMKAAKEDA